MRPGWRDDPRVMRAHIRLARRSDAAAIERIYAPIVRDTHISFETSAPGVAELEARISKTLRQYPWLVCLIDDKLAGYAYASAFRSRYAYQWTTETTVYVHGDFQRRGLSRALYHSLIAILRAQGYCMAIGVIALPNPASIRAHEALGFRKIGIFEKVGFKAGNWRDTGWWQLELRAMPASPQPPRPVSELAQTADFDALLEMGLPYIRN